MEENGSNNSNALVKVQDRQGIQSKGLGIR